MLRIIFVLTCLQWDHVYFCFLLMLFLRRCTNLKTTVVVLGHSKEKILLLLFSLKCGVCAHCRREQWHLFSSYGCWQQLVASTRRQSRDHAALGEVYTTTLVAQLAHLLEDVQRIYRKVGHQASRAITCHKRSRVTGDGHHEPSHILCEMASNRLHPF